MIEAGSARRDTRARIVAAAAQLLQQDGPTAVTTRGVAEAAGVQAPAIYRLFGDKDGLLEAVAEHVMATFVATKASVVEAAVRDDVDPLEDLRTAWRTQLEFGMANPTLFRLLSDPGRVAQSPAARSGRQVLEARVHRIAATGRLRVSEQRAVDLVQAAGVGVIQTLLATPPERRDPELGTTMYEAVVGRILLDAPTPRGDARSATVIAFRAIVPDLTALTDGERHVLTEWVDRAHDDLQRPPH